MRNCAICGKEIFRNPSHFKSKNSFCSRKHKEKGMILGLVAPMRLGTGYGVDDILRRRKYYKYRQFDRKHSFIEMDIGVREFCKMLKEGICYYCNGKKDLGFDRIDNKKGHTLDNTVIACSLWNMTRSNRFTKNQMKKIGKVIKTFYEEN